MLLLYGVFLLLFTYPEQLSIQKSTLLVGQQPDWQFWQLLKKIANVVDNSSSSKVNNLYCFESFWWSCVENFSVDVSVIMQLATSKVSKDLCRWPLQLAEYCGYINDLVRVLARYYSFEFFTRNFQLVAMILQHPHTQF